VSTLRPFHLLAVAWTAAALLGRPTSARAEIPMVDGKPLYFARDGAAFVVHGPGQGWRYDRILEGRIESDKAFFRGVRGGQQCIVEGTRELSCRDSFDSFDVQDGRAVFSFRKTTSDDKQISFVGFGKSVFETAYPKVKHLRQLGGRALFAASQDGRQWFVVDGDKPGPIFDDVIQLAFAGGKPLYVAERSGQTYVVYDGQQRGPFQFVEQLQIVEGQPLFAARKARHQWFLTYGDASFGPYSKTPHPRIMAAGKPLFVGRTPDGTHDVVMHGSDVVERCRAVQELQFVEGHPLYVCNKLAGSFAVYGKKRYGPYAGVSNLQLAGSQPLFMAGYNFATSLQHGTSSKAPQGLTSTHGRLFFGSGKPLYITSRDDGRFWHVVFGDYVSPFFNGIDELSLTLQGDQPVFAAWRNQRRYVVHGQKEHGPYDGILGKITIVDGKPLYLAIVKGKEKVVFGDQQEGPYDRVWELSVHGGKLLYFARTACHEFVVYSGYRGKPYQSVSVQLPEPGIAQINRTCPAQ
jgi:hypothetical protein